MIDPQRSVALVGRPNVGKSRLFNRLVGRRMAIVHDQPGVTRDVMSAEVGDNYILMDTGGIGLSNPKLTPEIIAQASEEAVDFAVQAASVILFVVDAKDGCTPLDTHVADYLRRSGKDPVLVLNKVDSEKDERDLHDFYKLGFKSVIKVSAEHNQGIGDLHEIIEKRLGSKPEVTVEEDLKDRIKIAFVGLPNVGKSSLCNALLKSDRMIVSEVAGTTRDSIQVDLDYKEGEHEAAFRLIDTAGMRARAKVSSPVEYFSSVRAEESVKNSDIVFIVLDALKGVTKQDKNLAGKVLESGAGLIVVVNKWDLAIDKFKKEPLPGYENIQAFQEKFEEAIRKELFFSLKCSVVFVSAKSGFDVDLLLSEAAILNERMNQKIPTGRLNQLLSRLIDKRPPVHVTGKRFKLYYGVLVGNKPFKVRLYCNKGSLLEDGYKRYLSAHLTREFGLEGCPISFELVGKTARFAASS